MEVIFIVLPLAVLMAIVALSAFFWAVHRGQFDDLDTPAYRAVVDDETNSPPAAGQSDSVRRTG